MAELFESLFSPYGHVLRYPRRAKLTGYEWSLECDLDGSFEFILAKPSIQKLEMLSFSEFMAFLAGFFDAEGTIILHKKRKSYAPEISISNSERGIIDFIFIQLRRIGFSAHTIWRRQAEDRAGVVGKSLVGRVVVWKFEEVLRFIGLLKLRHREKVAKASLVLGIRHGCYEDENDVVARWKELKATTSFSSS